MLTRWDPFQEINRLSGDFGRLFVRPERATFFPAVDVFEDEASITLSAEVPGLRSEDLKVEVERNVLTIRGERKLEREEKEGSYHRVERSYGSFSRSFALPQNVDAEQIGADLKEGVLTLRLPKREAPAVKQVEVRAS